MTKLEREILDHFEDWLEYIPENRKPEFKSRLISFVENKITITQETVLNNIEKK